MPISSVKGLLTGVTMVHRFDTMDEPSLLSIILLTSISMMNQLKHCQVLIVYEFLNRSTNKQTNKPSSV